MNDAMNEEAFPTTKPRATARPILSPSKTWTTSVSCINASGLVPDLWLDRKEGGYQPK